MRTFYAVNVVTQEHRLMDSVNGPLAQDEFVVEGDENGWIMNISGANPLPKGTPHQVIIEDDEPQSWTWDDSYITHYRPILDNGTGKQEHDSGWDWDGTGQPPLQSYVEVRKNDDDWRLARVVGYDDVRVVVKLLSGPTNQYESAVGGAIRPPKSDEDMAVEKMVADCGLDEDLMVGAAMDFARRLYRAGYRKQSDVE